MASQACIIHYDSIRTCDNLMKARQKTFDTLHTFAECKTRRSRSFENSRSNVGKIIQRWRGNLSDIKILFQYLKNISISRFHEEFLRNG